MSRLRSAMSRGELEARVLDGDRAQATAPPDVSSQLRLTTQAEADAWQQSADADARHDQAQADDARALATVMEGEKTRLEAANANYELWSAGTAPTRHVAGQAKAELARRGQEPATKDAPEPQTMTEWWRQLQADADAVDRAIEREHHAAADIGQPWPPTQQPQPEPGPESAINLEEPRPRPEIPEPAPDRDDERAARLDKLQTRAAAAAIRSAADNVERNARAEIRRPDRATSPGRS